MNRFPISLSCILLLSAASAFAETNVARRVFRPAAALRPHVLLVNVAGALPDADFASAAERAAAMIQVNVWTGAVARSVVPEAVADPGVVRRLFGSNAAVAVFVERAEKGPSFLQAPGCWSMVNLRGVERGAAAQVLADRYAKMLLKGIGHAAGAGATLDPKCSLFYGSFTLEGMDKTGVQISPQAYFPMLETLRAVAGTGILAPEGE